MRVQRLALTTTKNEVKSMFLFSQGLEDVRILRLDSNQVEAYVRFQAKAHADEAERFINDREMNGTKLVVKVVPRPSQAEIVKMAANMELYAADVRSQSPSSSDGLSTPATNGALSSVGEYTTARTLASPPVPVTGLSNGINGLGRLDTGLGGDIFRSALGNGHLGADSDVFPPVSALDRLTLNEPSSAINSTKTIDNAFMDSGYSAVRGLGPLDTEVGDAFGPLGESMSAFPRPRRQTNPAQSMAASRFGNLPALSTGGMNGFGNSTMGPMTAPPVGPPQGLNSQLNSPMAMNSPAGWSSTTTKPFYPNFPITSHPPANPADQNPPCNTLYVGNLPAQTSEDELKALFCRQRGYKRMCFRTKPQGPMCFVEFEDTHYATKALTELYGRALSNSTKGGVRLSFSKNPLGVRSQNNPSNPGQVPKPPIAGPNGIPGSAGGGLPALGGFPAPVRAPPGLSNPAGRQMPSLNTAAAADAVVNGISGPATAPPGPPPGIFGTPGPRTAQQTPSLNTAFSRAPNGLGAVGAGTPTTRLPPGFSASNGSSNGGFFSAAAVIAASGMGSSNGDHPGGLRSPIDGLRSPVDLGVGRGLGIGPGPIGGPVPGQHAR